MTAPARLLPRVFNSCGCKVFVLEVHLAKALFGNLRFCHWYSSLCQIQNWPVSIPLSFFTMLGCKSRLVLASYIRFLHATVVSFQADKMTQLIKAAGVEVEPIWITLFSRALEGECQYLRFMHLSMSRHSPQGQWWGIENPGPWGCVASSKVMEIMLAWGFSPHRYVGQWTVCNKRSK